MKTLLLCSLMFLLPLNIYTQNKEKEFKDFEKKILNEFNEYQQRVNGEYDAYTDSINREYIKMIDEASKEFSDLVQYSFKEFKPIKSDEPIADTKPDTIPLFRYAPPETVPIKLPEKFISYTKNQTILLPIELSDTNLKGEFKKLSLTFLGESFQIIFDNRLIKLPDMKYPSSEGIKKAYDYLVTLPHQMLLRQFIKIVNEMNLNDFDYYCLINEFSRSIINEPNSQKLIAWFLLIESGFKVKIGYNGNDMCLLFAPAQNLYNIPWFQIKGEKYYSFQNINGSIMTYEIDYFRGNKYLNLIHDKPLLMAEDKKERTVDFSFRGERYSITLAFDGKYIDYFGKYPMMQVDYYFTLPVSTVLKESVDNNIAPYTRNMDEYEALKFLLSLVQNGFNYKTDKDQFNQEKYMVPDEMLYYGTSDCDDKTIFFSFLVNELLHFDIIALSFNDHICSAVEVSDSSLKGNLKYNGKDYIICDATYTGAPPGMLLPQFQLKNAKIIDFNANLNKFRLENLAWDVANRKGLLQSDNGQNICFALDGSRFLTGIRSVDTMKAEIKSSGTETTRSFIAGLDSENIIKWIKQLNGDGLNLSYRIAQFDDQFLCVFGYFEGNLELDSMQIAACGHGSFFVCKIKNDGTALWLRKIDLPADSLKRGLTFVMDNAGNLKYYMPNDHFPYESNYMMQMDDKGNCYIYAMLPGRGTQTDISRDYSSNGKFDIIAYLMDANDRLLKQNYPRSVSLLYSLFQYLNNNGSVIEGISLFETIGNFYKNWKKEIPDRYSEVRNISEIFNSTGITFIKTVNNKPVVVNPIQAQNGSRLKLSSENGNARIDVLNGIKIGNKNIWNDVNYILFDRMTGEIVYNYDNQYRKRMPVHSQVL